MVPPAGRAPDDDGVNTNVAETLDRPVTTGDGIENNVKLAALYMAPDAIAFDAAMSALVCTVTEPPAVGVLPIVKPDNVTVTAVLAPNVIVPKFMTMDVAPGALEEKHSPHEYCPGIAKDTIGVELAEKKPEG